MNLGEKARDRVCADCYANSGEQFANHPERRTLLAQLDDAVLEWYQLCVTRRCWRRERADNVAETLRARCDVGGLAHTIAGELATNRSFLSYAKGWGVPKFKIHVRSFGRLRVHPPVISHPSSDSAL